MRIETLNKLMKIASDESEKADTTNQLSPSELQNSLYATISGRDPWSLRQKMRDTESCNLFD